MSNDFCGKKEIREQNLFPLPHLFLQHTHTLKSAAWLQPVLLCVSV